MTPSTEFLLQKIDLVQRILAIEDPNLLHEVEIAVMNALIPDDWYEHLNDEDKEAIHQSRIEFEAGEVVDNDELMRKMSSRKQRKGG
jgi:hypothetical protein